MLYKLSKKITLYTLFVLTPYGLIGQNTNKEINAAALQNGSYMYQTPASYKKTNLMGGTINNYTPESLFDLSSKVWCSPANHPYPHTFIIEFTETFIIEKLVFDNRCEDYAGISTKDISVSYSNETPNNNNFINEVHFKLNPKSLNKFKVPPTEAKAIKITINSNHGNATFTELAEFKAIGNYKSANINLINISGDWETNWGGVNFVQNGTSVSGSYEYMNGVIKCGGINRNSISFKWVEKTKNRYGRSVLFMNETGTRLTGIWCLNDNWNKYGFWIMDRKKGIPFSTKMDKIELKKIGLLEPDKEIVRELKNTIKREAKVVLYGINFENNSAKITPNSNAILNQLAAVLLEDKNMKIKIEGHTDNLGSEKSNLKLSNDRALATKEFLIKNFNIAADRITTMGKGESKPITSNNTESGKFINRRVEIYQIR